MTSIWKLWLALRCGAIGGKRENPNYVNGRFFSNIVYQIWLTNSLCNVSTVRCVCHAVKQRDHFHKSRIKARADRFGVIKYMFIHSIYLFCISMDQAENFHILLEPDALQSMKISDDKKGQKATPITTKAPKRICENSNKFQFFNGIMFSQFSQKKSGHRKSISNLFGPTKPIPFRWIRMNAFYSL